MSWSLGCPASSAVLLLYHIHCQTTTLWLPGCPTALCQGAGDTSHLHPPLPTYRCLLHSTWYVASPGVPGSVPQLRRTWKFCASSLTSRGGSGVPGQGGSRGASGGSQWGPRSFTGHCVAMLQGVSLLGISTMGAPPTLPPPPSVPHGKP